MCQTWPSRRSDLARACLSRPARFLFEAKPRSGTMKRELDIRTSDGTAKAAIFRPQAGPAKAAVILYMAAFGPRPTLDEMAERLAGQGYMVLVPDLFYRNAPYGPFDA